MRLFELHRETDVSGSSGTGVVAEGVEFWDGECAMRWKTPTSSTAVYHSIVELEHIHGHEGKTKVVWLSELEARKKAALLVGLEGGRRWSDKMGMVDSAA